MEKKEATIDPMGVPPNARALEQPAASLQELPLAVFSSAVMTMLLPDSPDEKIHVESSQYRYMLHTPELKL